MDLHQLSPQIGAMPASGELSFGAGTSLGSPSQESGFSSVLQAASQRIDARREARSRAFQAERENQPSGTTQPVHRGLSSKTEGSRRATRPAAQAEHENRPPARPRRSTVPCCTRPRAPRRLSLACLTQSPMTSPPQLRPMFRRPCWTNPLPVPTQSLTPCRPRAVTIHPRPR